MSASTTIERLSRPGAQKVLSWCPSCQIQLGEVALPVDEDTRGTDRPFDLSPITEFFASRLDDLRPLFVHPVNRRVALQERSALPGIMAAVKAILERHPGAGGRGARRPGAQHPGQPPLGPA